MIFIIIAVIIAIPVLIIAAGGWSQGISEQHNNHYRDLP